MECTCLVNLDFVRCDFYFLFFYPDGPYGPLYWAYGPDHDICMIVRFLYSRIFVKVNSQATVTVGHP